MLITQQLLPDPAQLFRRGCVDGVDKLDPAHCTEGARRAVDVRRLRRWSRALRPRCGPAVRVPRRADVRPRRKGRGAIHGGGDAQERGVVPPHQA